MEIKYSEEIQAHRVNSLEVSQSILTQTLIFLTVYSLQFKVEEMGENIF